MKSLALFAFLAAGSTALAIVAHPGRSAEKPPPAGKYTGLLTVRRTLIQEGLETSFTVKVEARVAADGQVTILTATPESPGAAAKIENSVIRAVPNPPVVVPPSNTVPIQTPFPIFRAPSIPGPLGQFILVPSFSNYLVNGTIPAVISVAPRMVYLKYSVETWRTSTLVANQGTGLASNTSPVDAPITSNSSPVSSLGTPAPGTNVLSGPVVITPGILLRTPESRVSYEYQLRFQRPLPAVAVPLTPR